MIVVDTSVWVEALRDGGSWEAGRLRNLLDEDRAAIVAPVKLELLLGASRRQEPGLRRLLSALPCWYPQTESWQLAESWIEPALRAGQRFGFADLLIAAIAHEKRARIWSLDRDFERLQSLGFATLFQ